MKAKSICIVSQKGGIGKTSTAVNTASILAEMGFRTLILDTDIQGNSSTSLGIDNYNVPTIYDVLHKNKSIDAVILETGIVNLSVIASNILTAKLEREMYKVPGHEELLLKAIKNSNRCKNSFDFIIFDCPPSLGALSINALVASDYCIIPVQPGIFALEGVSSLLDTINSVKEEYGRPEILGILLTFFDARTILSHRILKDLKATGLAFNTYIRVSQAIPKAQDKKLPVNICDDASRGSQDYRGLACEILKKVGVEKPYDC